MEGSTGSDSGPNLVKVPRAEKASVPREDLKAEVEAPDLGFAADGSSQTSFSAVGVNVRAGSDAAAAYECREARFFSDLESAGGCCSEALPFEPRSSRMKEFEPHSLIMKEFEPHSLIMKEFEPRSSSLKEFEPRSSSTKEFVPRSSSMMEFEPQSSSTKEFEPQSSSLKEGGGAGTQKRGAFAEPSLLAVGDEALRGRRSEEAEGDADGEKREILAGTGAGMLQGSRSVPAALNSALDEGREKGMEDLADDFVQGGGRSNGNARRAESLPSSAMAVDGHGGEDDLEERRGGNAGEDARAACSAEVDFAASDLRSTVEGEQAAEEVFGNFIWVEEEEDDCGRTVELVESVEQSFSTAEDDCVYGSGETLAEDENREGNYFLVGNLGFEVPHCEPNGRGGTAMDEVPEKVGLENVQEKGVEQDSVSNFSCPVIEDGVQESLERAPAGMENKEEQSFLARWQDGCAESSGAVDMVCEAPGVSLEDGGIKGMEVLCEDIITEDAENKNTENDGIKGMEVLCEDIISEDGENKNTENEGIEGMEALCDDIISEDGENKNTENEGIKAVEVLGDDIISEDGENKNSDNEGIKGMEALCDDIISEDGENKITENEGIKGVEVLDDDIISEVGENKNSDNEGIKGMEVLCDDIIYEDGENKNTEQNESVNPLFPSAVEEAGDELLHDCVANRNMEGSDFCIGLQDGGPLVQEQTEGVLASQEETSINGVDLHSIAIDVVEKNHTGFRQDHVEQEGTLKEMGFVLVETKEPVMTAEFGLADIDQVGFQNISGMAEDRCQETDSLAIRVDPAACSVPKVQGLLPVERGSGGGPIDAMANVNKSQGKDSIGLISQVQPGNALDKPLAEVSHASEETGQETHLDTLAPTDKVEPMERIQCNVRAGYTQNASEEPSFMEITEAADYVFTQKPITGLVTMVQPGDEIPATVEDQGTSEASACVKTVKGLSDVVVSGTDSHQNLKKESRDIVGFNEPPTCGDLGNKPDEGVQFGEPFNPMEKKENDMQDGSSSSPLSETIKMNRRRKSFNPASTSEQLSLNKRSPKQHQFSVGDLVWGKVRSHPWWPGQIFDASHSSEIAKKYFKKNCMLVAYFGDATFAWCKGDESHLIAFQDNFAEKSKQTPVKGFGNAVMNALDELARRVELGLTCFCQCEEARSRLERKAMVNAGIRDGAIVNDHRDITSAVNSFNPLEFLSTIQSWARSPLMDCTLDVTVARAQASAILTFKGLLLSGKISGESLGKWTASQEMAGSTSPSHTFKSRIINLDIIPGSKFMKSCSSSSGKRRCKSEGMQSRSPKKRRIGDLISGDEISSKADEGMDGHDETLLEIAGSKAKFLRRLLKIRRKSLGMESALNKRSSETANTIGHMLEKMRNDDVVKMRQRKGSLPGKATLSKTAKTKEGGCLLRELTPVKNNQHQKLETISASDPVVKDFRAMLANRCLTALSSGGDQDVKKTPKSFNFGECIMKAASELTSTPLGTRCRDEKAGSLHRKVILPKTAEPKEELCLPRKVTLVRPKKHQKLDALCSSDAIINDFRSVQAKRDLVSSCSGDGQHAKKTPKSFKFGECILKVASELTSTTPGTKCTDGEAGHNTQEGGRKLSANADKNIFSSPSSKPKAMWPFRESGSTRELLLELLMVAQQPLYWVEENKMPSRLINSFLLFRNAVFQKSPGYGFYDSDVTKASAFKFLSQSHKLKFAKSSTKLAGSSNPGNSQESDWNDKISFPNAKVHRVQGKLKRKAELPVEGARKKSRHSIRLPSPPWSTKSSNQKQKQSVGDRYAKQYSRRTILPQLPIKSSQGLPDDGNANQNPASLFMRFPKGFALPSETELKAKFTRFGPLEISETKVFRRSGCAQVVFKRRSDAEVAFNFVSENNLFGSASVSFRLKFLSSATQTNTIRKTDNEIYEKSIQQEFRHGRQPPLLKDIPRDVQGHQENMVQPCSSIVPFAEKVGPSRPNALGEPPLRFIQQNLEMMTSMLSRSAECASTSTMPKSDNVAPDSKADIMDEMMCLLQKVSALVGSSPP